MRFKFLSNSFPLILALIALLSAFATYYVITSGELKLVYNQTLIILLVFIDFVLAVALSAFIFRRILSFGKDPNRAFSSSKLQTRIVLMFSLVAAIPTIIVALFSILFFKFGIYSWFNERVNTALQQSVAVAEAYLQEHKQVIQSDAMAVANDLNRQAFAIRDNKRALEQMLSVQSGVRKLNEVIVFQYKFQKSTIIARSPMSFLLAHELEDISDNIMSKKYHKDIEVMTEDADKVQAITKLDNYPDTYLLVGRFVDSKIIGYMENTQDAYREYIYLKSGIGNLQIKFLTIFVIVAILLLLAAIWLGIAFASYLTRPLVLLSSTVESIKEGNLSARVPEGKIKDEITILGQAFNKMAAQLESQRKKLIETNQELDTKRRFSDTVLSGVSAGVLAIDQQYVITLANRSAVELLKLKNQDIINAHISKILPELEYLLNEAKNDYSKPVSAEISLIRHGRRMTWSVSVTTEFFSGDVSGFIMTFEDITEFVSAQRSAAWADVARRIAHEIKNPLTPIQLAAERLKRKYSSDSSDAETFSKYVDTIVRHAGDIGLMVEEFVNFAKIKAPTLKPVELKTLLKEIIFSEEYTHPIIKYEYEFPIEEIIILCDRRQITQVFANILKNSAESIESKLQKEELDNIKNSDRTIKIKVELEKESCRIQCVDSGIGFPVELIDRITEPYVTTRTKGTGLGLAIVKKIVEEHNGTLQLGNHENGAYVTVVLPKSS